MMLKVYVCFCIWGGVYNGILFGPIHPFILNTYVYVYTSLLWENVVEERKEN